MSALSMIITNAGLAALTNAQNDGTDPIVITHVALGSGHWTPTAAATALQSEIKRVTSISGGAVDDYRLHVSVRDASADAYSVGEFGLITDAGVLFAIYSQPTDIIVKAAPSVLLMASDTIFSGNVIGAITVSGDLGFDYPPASETVVGVVELATIAEVQAGEDAFRAVTPAGLAARTATETRTGLLELATLAEARAGTDTGRGVTPAGLVTAAGNYSKYIPVLGSPYIVNPDDVGAMIIAYGSSSAFTLPLLTNVARIGAAFTFFNLTASAITMTRAGSNTLSGVDGSTTSVVVGVRQSVTLVKLSNTEWGVIGSIIGEIFTKLNAVPFQKEYISGWANYQSRPGAGFITSTYDFTHGLGGAPKLITMEMECLVADGFYTVGDVIELSVPQSSSQSNGSSSFDAGFAVKKTATQIRVAFDGNHGMMLHEWNDDSNFRPANNSWKFRFRAWA